MVLLRYYLWFAPHVLLGFVLAVMFYRKLQWRLPIFATYIFFDLAQFLASVILAFQSPFPRTVYHWVVVFGAAVNTLLVLAVIYELANELVLSRSSLARIFQVTLKTSLAALVLVAATVSGALSDISLERVTNIFEVVDFSSSLILAGMLLTLFALTRAFRISWRSWATGIALGFGISANIDLAGAALRAGFGKRALIPVDVTQMAAFHVCVLVWLVYVFQADRTSQFDNRLPQSDLELWDQEMRKMVQR